jgi:hypothetical protein
VYFNIVFFYYITCTPGKMSTLSSDDREELNPGRECTSTGGASCAAPPNGERRRHDHVRRARMRPRDGSLYETNDYIVAEVNRNATYVMSETSEATPGSGTVGANSI